MALVGSPVMAMPPVGAGADPSADVAAMPCHDAGPAASAEPACEEGCCPQPECPPANCRVAAPMVGVSVWVLPMALRVPHSSPSEVAVPAAAPVQEQLRPPIS